MPSTAKKKSFTYLSEGHPFGGFDVESHLVEMSISAQTYKSIKAAQKAIKALYKTSLSPYCIELWCDIDAWDIDYDDDMKPVKGEPVRTERELLRVTDGEILWTYHSSKYHDGVHWETESLPIAALDKHFNPR